MYAVTTQDRWPPPPRSPTIRGSAVLTMRLSSIASRIAISSPGSTIMTSRCERKCPPPPGAPCPFTAAGAAPFWPLMADPALPCPFCPGTSCPGPFCPAAAEPPRRHLLQPDPVPEPSVARATRGLLPLRSAPPGCDLTGYPTYRPASYYAKVPTNRPSS